ncbi:hypothetical protein EGW08_005286 [Elysia chlorotica]|uniref:Uncharacterized protein n=1 Tax=Elysia chlorotica TaxID=188477 RepID=A0A3S1C9Y3_ELYCH|nr:hypothetical protein EGW08_005286 [Elysia chlorotica]
MSEGGGAGGEPAVKMEKDALGAHGSLSPGEMSRGGAKLEPSDSAAPLHSTSASSSASSASSEGAGHLGQEQHGQQGHYLQSYHHNLHGMGGAGLRGQHHLHHAHSLHPHHQANLGHSQLQPGLGVASIQGSGSSLCPPLGSVPPGGPDPLSPIGDSSVSNFSVENFLSPSASSSVTPAAHLSNGGGSLDHMGGASSAGSLSRPPPLVSPHLMAYSARSAHSAADLYRPGTACSQGVLAPSHVLQQRLPLHQQQQRVPRPGHPAREQPPGRAPPAPAPGHGRRAPASPPAPRPARRDEHVQHQQQQQHQQPVQRQQRRGGH